MRKPLAALVAADRTAALELSLASFVPLEPSEIDFIRATAGEMTIHRAGAEIPPGASGAGAPRAVVSGWACWAKLLPDGRRQIAALLLPGDVFGCGAMRTAGMTILALTDCRIVDLEDLADGVGRREPALQRLTDAWTAAERAADARLVRQLVRLGRLSAAERALDLLAELYERQLRNRMTAGDRLALPLTQEVLADVLGLSIVHVNRVLQQLRREHLITDRPGRQLQLDLDRVMLASEPG